MEQNFMEEALKEAYSGIKNHHGGPFGCVIVKDGKIVGRGHNCVVSGNDPTRHGEMEAIRDACKNLNTFDLSGAVLFTTSEPCPMCLGAILWANIHKVYYGCTCADAAEIGFRDSDFYDYLNGNSNILELEELERKECKKLFSEYSNMKGNKKY